MPDVPTIAETFPGFDAATWCAGGADRRAEDAVARINAETKKIVATKDFQERFEKLGMIRIRTARRTRSTPTSSPRSPNGPR